MTRQSPAQKFYIPAPCSEALVLVGLRWLAGQLDLPGSQGVVVIQTWHQLEDGMFASALGSEAGRTRKTRTVPLPTKSGPRSVPITTAHKLAVHGATAALLLWPDEDLIAAVHGRASQADILAVAWVPGDETSWEQRLGMRRLGAPVTHEADPHPVVHAALAQLTSMVNLSTGLGHPSDEDAFVEILHILRSNGEHLDGDYVTRTLQQLGWGMDHAIDAGSRAKRFAEGHTLRRRRPGFVKPEAIDRWRSAAQRS